jgi:hypothetical protein
MRAFRSAHLEAAAGEVAGAARAAGLTPKQAEALAREELRLLERVARDGDRYLSLRTFLEALCSRTG